MSSSQLTFTPSFFRGVSSNHQPVPTSRWKGAWGDLQRCSSWGPWGPHVIFFGISWDFMVIFIVIEWDKNGNTVGYMTNQKCVLNVIEMVILPKNINVISLNILHWYYVLLVLRYDHYDILDMISSSHHYQYDILNQLNDPPYYQKWSTWYPQTILTIPILGYFKIEDTLWSIFETHGGGFPI